MIMCSLSTFRGIMLRNLFAFIGDLGGSAEHDELGGDMKSKGHAGLPNSPSSSGGFRQFSSKRTL